VLRHTLGVIDIVNRAAALAVRASMVQLRQAALVPQLHGQADHRKSALLQTGRNLPNCPHRRSCPRQSSGSDLRSNPFAHYSVKSRDCRLLVNRGNSAQPFNHLRNRFQREIDFSIGSLAAKAQAQRGARIFRSETERHEHVRWVLNCSR